MKTIQAVPNRVFFTRLSFLILFSQLIGGLSLSTAQDAIVERPAESSPNTIPKDHMVKVYRLESASPEMAAEVIRTLFQSEKLRLAVDPRSNGIILSGPESVLKAVEAVLVKIDEKQERQSRIMSLKNITPDDALRLLSQQFGKNGDLRMVADHRNNSLLLSGDEKTLLKMTAFAEALDRPAEKGQLAGKNVLIYSYWIVDRDQIKKSYPEWNLREIPKSIETLVNEKLAKRTHIKQPLMAANLAIQACVGETPELPAVIENRGSGKIDALNSFEIDVQGNLWNSPADGNKIDIELQLQIGLQEQKRSGGASQVQTRIKTPLRHPVCLGLTPVNGIDSILVIEIVEAD